MPDIILLMIDVMCSSVTETKALAEKIGHVLRGGEVLELVSDVGGGKTTLVKGLALGLGVDEVVQSPTFTISRIYNARAGLELHHFDFYRLSQPGIMAAELAESLSQPNAIVIIEWSDIVRGVLPETRLLVRISALSNDERRLRFAVPQTYDYVREALQSFKQQQSVA